MNREIMDNSRQSQVIVSRNILTAINLILIRFFAYSLLGWLVETAYIYIVKGHFAKRGLYCHYLPLIPLFGFGGVIIVALLSAYKHRPLLLFISAVGLSTIMELLTSLMNSEIFNRQTWSYANMPLSFEGRVALPISIGWGLMVVLSVYLIDPALKRLSSFISRSRAASGFILGLAAYVLVCLLSDLFILI